jgi:signal transduction histidine kinase
MKRSRHAAKNKRAKAAAKMHRVMKQPSRKAQRGLQSRVHKGLGALDKSSKTEKQLERLAREAGSELYRTAISQVRGAQRTLEAQVAQRTAELRAANKELEKEIARRRGLEGEILEISDREQQRLGQELHDGLCQHLTAVAFMARSVASRLKNHRVIEVDDIEKIAQLVNDAANDARDLSRALHRTDVDSAGLVNALQDLVDREIWKTPCRLDVRPGFRIENDLAASHLYRIAREAVINANKHAQAREIVVELRRSRKEITLSITDDGVGFRNEPKLNQGLGFHIMNYRARSMGGRLEIKSGKKGGTCVACYLSARK